MLVYTVAVTFPDVATADAWRAWLRNGHVADVMAGGAVAAEVVRVDGGLRYEVRYRFPSREAFERYERDHAPRLRAEGRSKFPPERGIAYERATAELLDTYGSDSEHRDRSGL
jgi:hypothetical protein